MDSESEDELRADWPPWASWDHIKAAQAADFRDYRLVQRHMFWWALKRMEMRMLRGETRP